MSNRNTPPVRPFVPIGGKLTVYADHPGGTDAVRYMSVDRSTPARGGTRCHMRDKAKTARIAEHSQPAGRFRRWWQVVDSNHRRRSRRFYSTLLQPESPPSDQRVCASRRVSGCHRPLCVRACRGRGRRNARTGTDGEGRSGARTACRSGMPTVLRHRLPADLPIQAAGSLASQVVEPTAERASCTHSAASPPPAASISSIICTGTMYSPICSARWRGQGRMVTFL